MKNKLLLTKKRSMKAKQLTEKRAEEKRLTTRAAALDAQLEAVEDEIPTELETEIQEVGDKLDAIGEEIAALESEIADLDTVTFTRSPYETYQQFVNWLNAAQTLTLIYSPMNGREFCRDVGVRLVQKGELNAVGWLECAFSLVCHTPCYLPTPTTVSLENSGMDESKRYDYSYSETFRYGNDSSSFLSCSIAGAGHIPGALELTYSGAIVNPRFRLTGNTSGKTYGICSVEAVFTATDRLKLSTLYNNSFIKKTTADGEETDLLDVLDISTNPFFKIPVDEPCTIYIEADSPFSGVAELLIYYYYRSV